MSKEGVERTAATLAKRIAPIYALLKWHWSRFRGPPTEEEIREELVELYEQLSSDKFVEGAADSISTGGLEVYRYRDEERCVHYVFRFKVEEHLDWHDFITHLPALSPDLLHKGMEVTE